MSWRLPNCPPWAGVMLACTVPFAAAADDNARTDSDNYRKDHDFLGVTLQVLGNDFEVVAYHQGPLRYGRLTKPAATRHQPDPGFMVQVQQHLQSAAARAGIPVAGAAPEDCRRDAQLTVRIRGADIDLADRRTMAFSGIYLNAEYQLANRCGDTIARQEFGFDLGNAAADAVLRDGAAAVPTDHLAAAADALIDDALIVWMPPWPAANQKPKPISPFSLSPLNPPFVQRHFTKRAEAGGLAQVVQQLADTSTPVSWTPVVATAAIGDVRYDLRFEDDHGSVHEFRDLAEPSWSGAAELTHCARYAWNVRARFMQGNIPRMSPPMSIRRLSDGYWNRSWFDRRPLAQQLTSLVGMTLRDSPDEEPVLRAPPPPGFKGCLVNSAQTTRVRPTALTGEPRLAIAVDQHEVCAPTKTAESACKSTPVAPETQQWLMNCLQAGFTESSSYHPDIALLGTDQANRSHVIHYSLRDMVGRIQGDNMSGGGPNAAFLGGKVSRERQLYVSARILESSGIETGVVESTTHGSRAFTAAVGVVGGGDFAIPLPLIFPSWKNLDYRDDACLAVGRDVARFLYSTEKPAAR